MAQLKKPLGLGKVIKGSFEEHRSKLSWSNNTTNRNESLKLVPVYFVKGRKTEWLKSSRSRERRNRSAKAGTALRNFLTELREVGCE